MQIKAAELHVQEVLTLRDKLRLLFDRNTEENLKSRQETSPVLSQKGRKLYSV